MMDYDGTKRIGYFFNEEIGKFSYGPKHFMDPKRIAMTHSLIVGYGLYRHLDVYETREASNNEIAQFHSQDYVNYLECYISSDRIQLMKYLGLEEPIVNENMKNDIQNKQKYGIGLQFDCPGFDGLYNFCQLSTGGSIDAAHLITQNQADIAINWGGGLHHAKKGEASGFCYANDIVVCILELLKQYNRVVYIDIDVHHGDGVEEAFYCTNRVMTVSFHQYGEHFFPGTGALNSIGEKDGLFHSINVPLMPGMTDDMYRELFQNVMQSVMDNYKPDCIVLESGADSIAYDQIGNFNMSIKGHGNCIQFLMKFGIPIVVLGGGGYTINNVSRCWTFETGLITGQYLDEKEKIPADDKFSYLYQLQNKLHIDIMPNQPNLNTVQNINSLQSSILQYLKEIEGRPSVQFHQVPDSYLFKDEYCFEDEILNRKNNIFDFSLEERDEKYENDDIDEKDTKRAKQISKKEIFQV